MTPVPGRTVCFGNCRLHRNLTWFAFSLIAVLLTALAMFFRVSPPFDSTAPDPNGDGATALRMSLHADHTPRQHLELLKTFRLWDLSRRNEIPKVLFDRYPPDLHLLPDVAIRKKIFLHTLLPVALTALNEVARERSRFDIIMAKAHKCLEANGATNDSAVAGQTECLDRDEAEFISFLHDKYRTSSMDQLQRRVNVVPVSLILAQGAVESSWGDSRFTRLGNNLFGMWTWGAKGMVPRQRDEGKTHKVMRYDSILDSVRDYLLTLNRLNAYGSFRTIRQQTLDPLALTEGLLLYSERGQGYVDDLKKVISHNKLQDFDRFRLAKHFSQQQ